MTARGPVDVLVVGAGPTGLFAAAELARNEVSARVIEREPTPHRQARATALQPGTLEILARAGVLDPFLAGSEHLAYARVFDGDLNPVGEIAFAGAGCPHEFQCSLPQWRTEEILARHLSDLGGQIERGVTATGIDATEDGVRLALEHPDGSTEVAEAQWVIGAGGAHSITRFSMEEVLTGETYPGVALVGDVQVEADLPRDGSALIASPQGYVLLAPLPQDRWITFVGDLHPDELRRLDDDDPGSSVAAALKRRAGDRVRLTAIAWASPFRMHRRLVSRLAGSRRFLLGDAGHLSSPFGGEGLNSGLHDAHNLAWKLSLVLDGRARPVLLDSFDAERLPANHHVLEVSDRLHQMAKGAVESARTGTRPSPPTPEQVAALVQSRSMLDVTYAEGPLVGEYLGPGVTRAPEEPPVGRRHSDRGSLTGTNHHLIASGVLDADLLARLGQRWQGLLDVRQADSTVSRATLVRPDGHIGFRAQPADAAGLSALDAHLGSYLIPSATGPD